MMKLANVLSAKFWAVVLLGVGSTGCTTLTQPISGIPANRLPPQFFAEEKNSLVPIDFSLLGQERPRQHLLDKGDVLGIYVDRVLPFTEPDAVPVMPPVNFPAENSTLPPSTGFPFTVLEDGTISLPLIRPLKVKGLTLDQTRDLIRKSYVESKILMEDGNQFVSPVVTLIRERDYNIVVIRQDMGSIGGTQQQGRGGVQGADQSARGNIVKLPAYQNDVLHALMETGGLPGINAKNEVKILRNSRADQAARQAFNRQYAEMIAAHCDPCSCPPPLPDDPTATRIPMRLPMGATPSLAPEDIILEDGDIVLVESRDNEFFYTGGLLPGGQWPLPRDYDLDALGAMALAGGGVQSSGRGGGGGLLGGAQGIGGVPPGRLYILRRTPCKGQIAIEVDLARAINHPSARPIIQPGDTLILQYRPIEEALNFGLGSFFTFGIQQLLQQR